MILVMHCPHTATRAGATEPPIGATRTGATRTGAVGRPVAAKAARELGVDERVIRSYHPGMPIWRCPHCGTPQAETARCWVCRRSSTTCSTCRNFCRSVATQVGYCGLDRGRMPLTGTELRGCWTPGPARTAGDVPTASAAEPPEPASPALRLRDFVPVEFVRRDADAARRAVSAGAPHAAAITSPTEPERDPARAWATLIMPGLALACLAALPTTLAVAAFVVKAFSA